MTFQNVFYLPPTGWSHKIPNATCLTLCHIEPCVPRRTSPLCRCSRASAASTRLSAYRFSLPRSPLSRIIIVVAMYGNCSPLCDKRQTEVQLARLIWRQPTGSWTRVLWNPELRSWHALAYCVCNVWHTQWTRKPTISHVHVHQRHVHHQQLLQILSIMYEGMIRQYVDILALYGDIHL